MGHDSKYGKVTTEHGDIPDDEPVIVFRAKDKLLPAVLAIYLELCDLAGSPERHMRIVADTYSTMRTWQRDNPGKVKTPDSERSREWLGE